MGFSQQAPRITAKLLAQAAIDRRRNKILPLAAHEDLQSIISAPEEAGEPTASLAAPPLPADPLPGDAALAGTDAESSYQAGLTLRRSRDFKGAIEQFERAALHSAYRLKAFGQIGLCYKAMGEPHRAVLAFRKAMAHQSPLRQDNLSLRYLLGTTLEQLGDMPEAIEQYQKISRTDRGFKDVVVRLSRLEDSRLSTEPWRRPASVSFMGKAWKNLRQILQQRTEPRI